MKTQTVKNAVIVPVGAKGGFVVKRPPPTNDRAAMLAEGVECYRTFVGGLLDVTDNLVGGVPVRPPGTVHYDDAVDAYLVVAADKGTASFSDIANELARATISGSTTRSPREARAATTTRRWASPLAAPGSRCARTAARSGSTSTSRH